MSFMGSGFSAINIGDEIVEINNQVVVRTSLAPARSPSFVRFEDRLGCDTFP